MLALGARGLPLRLFGPNHWDELSDGLDRGLAGVQTVDWPYRGLRPLGPPDHPAGRPAADRRWRRRSRSSRPAAARPLLSCAGLVVLLLAYGSAVTENDPGAPLLRGLALLVLVGAWLWLPRLGPREALAGAGLVLALGALSLPVAAALDADRPWWNYGAWTWFENGKAITFDWNTATARSTGRATGRRCSTSSRPGRTTGRPRRWTPSTGLRWVRGGTSDSMHELQGVPDATSADRHWDYFEWNRKWDAQLASPSARCRPTCSSRRGPRI